MKKHLLTTLTLGMITTALNAANCQPLTTGGACFDVDIVRLYTATNATYIDTSADETGLEGACDITNTHYLKLKETTPNYARMHDLLVASQVSGKKVIVRVMADSNNTCQIAYVTMDN